MSLFGVNYWSIVKLLNHKVRLREIDLIVVPCYGWLLLSAFEDKLEQQHVHASPLYRNTTPLMGHMNGIESWNKSKYLDYDLKTHFR